MIFMEMFFYFLRNKALNANEPFIKARGLERPILTRNQFGGTLGGRIVRDKAFFFVSYQGTARTQWSFAFQQSNVSHRFRRLAR